MRYKFTVDVNYKDGSSMHLDGLGMETVAGVVRDALAGDKAIDSIVIRDVRA